MALQPSFDDRFPHILSWNSNSTRIAIATMDWVDSQGEYLNQQAQIIDVSSGQQVLSISVGDLNILHLSWENNDTELVVVDAVGDVRRFNVQNGTLIGQWNVQEYVSAGIDVSPSGNQIAMVVNPISPNGITSSDDKILQIRDLINGNIAQSFSLPLPPAANVNWLGWSPDGTRVAITSSRGSILVYTWNGAILTFQREIIIVSDRTGITYGAWGPDSRLFATATYRATTVPGIVIYNTDNGTLIRQVNQSTGAFDITWSPETNLIAARLGLTARVWDGSTGQIVQDFTYSNTYLISLAWSPNGTLAIGQQITYDQLVQIPNLTGVVAQRPSILPTLTPTPTNTFTLR